MYVLYQTIIHIPVRGSISELPNTRIRKEMRTTPGLRYKIPVYSDPAPGKS